MFAFQTSTEANKQTNRTKTTTNDCSGTMGKSKQVDIFAPSCSAVQLGRKDKQWTGVAGAFVEHQHLFRLQIESGCTDIAL